MIDLLKCFLLFFAGKVIENNTEVKCYLGYRVAQCMSRIRYSILNIILYFYEKYLAACLVIARYCCLAISQSIMLLYQFELTIQEFCFTQLPDTNTVLLLSSSNTTILFDAILHYQSIYCIEGMTAGVSFC